MNWNVELLRMQVRELERRADEMQERVDEARFAQCLDDTLIGQAVNRWIEECGL